MPNENHAEVAEIEYCASRFGEIGNSKAKDILLRAAADERKIASGELVPAPVKCGECANKPFCECVINNHYEDDDFCSYGERKDDNHA